MAARVSKRLTAMGVIKMKAPGRYADGDGLYLHVRDSGSKTWIYRFRQNGKLHEMGLGAVADVDLKSARELAYEAKKLHKQRLNPIIERKTGGLIKSSIPTFGQYKESYIAGIEDQWKNDKHRAQWKMTLDVYASPLHKLKITDITTADIHAVLLPIWYDKPETASRLRGRIEKVLNAAKTEGFYTSENPARWKGHLENLLPPRKKLTRGHFAAMPYIELPAFVQDLRNRDAVTARALEFHILCASRPGMVEAMTDDEIDWDEKLWVVPAAKMKLPRDHIVPLSERAFVILGQLKPFIRQHVVFWGQRPGRHISSNALRALMQRMGVGHYTPHGFRSSFRDWAGDETDHSEETAEHALAHSVGDDTQKAYRRATALRKRRQLMADWAAYLNGTPPQSDASPRSPELGGDRRG
ncbi:tyrosine-type recombinase/integrase [Asticcacaulis machinosus]|uniref:Integrase arm-type DNA-binding domain-containing protein n=1 Tax=Asticcacaulis machinosus TaxID=2984211 RepID=A0ABT5HH01_9CAUL|nr:site-specific integrase [Asticcacaulis machinosus]MDC7675415.1 integrase arm-type DNA-binding domain-containing protein [Asticcacaulis machinosus]